jgi:uncharacterized protein
MINHLFRIKTLMPLSVMLTLSIGCSSSPPTRFYLLNSMGGPAKEAQPSIGDRCFTIGVGPVKLADYLDRQQIVTRAGSNELRLAEFDKWAEPLDRNFSRVMAENLSSLLCTKTIMVFPWSGSVPIEYRVEVEILHLDGKPGESATLEAQWFVFGGGDTKKLLVAKRSSFTEPSGGQDYQSLVSAQSRTVAALTREIAEAIKTFSR